jgi:N-formylglutamate deformylase
MQPFHFHQGSTPLLISIPHMGTYLPPEIATQLTDKAQQVADTDWHLDRLYHFAKAQGASILQATHSRYVIDLNRPPDNQSLYPGQATTALCPLLDFDGEPIYRDKQGPTAAEVAQRRERYWQPYHQQLRQTLDQLKAQHGHALLWDAHSIRSVLPQFFEGKLTDLNLGTFDGASCDPNRADAVFKQAQAATGYSAVLNGRYKGGYITRHYGQPSNGVHAIQLELTQCSYMQEVWPFAYDEVKAADFMPVLRGMVGAFCG